MVHFFVFTRTGLLTARSGCNLKCVYPSFLMELENNISWTFSENLQTAEQSGRGPGPQIRKMSEKECSSSLNELAFRFVMRRSVLYPRLFSQSTSFTSCLSPLWLGCNYKRQIVNVGFKSKSLFLENGYFERDNMSHTWCHPTRCKCKQIFWLWFFLEMVKKNPTRTKKKKMLAGFQEASGQAADGPPGDVRT